MTEPPPSPELAQVKAAVTAFLERCEKRGKSSGSAGCLVTIVAAIVLASMGALANGGGWALLVIGSFVLFGVLAKQAVKQSVVDFQHTFRGGAGAARREAAIQLLWERAHGAAAKTRTGKAAKELLDQLGIRARPTPRDLESPTDSHASQPEVLVLPAAPPRVEPPTVRAPHEHRPTAAKSAHKEASGRPAPNTPPRVAPPPVEHRRVPEPARRDLPREQSVEFPTAPSHARVEPASEREARGSSSAQASAPIERSSAGSAIPPSPPPSVSLAPHGASFGSTEHRVVCDYCGVARTVPAGEASNLCPNCFPQIRLEA